MANQTSAAEVLRKLANEVKDSDPGGYERLNLLGDAIEHGTNAEAWTYTDVHTMIAPDSIVERYRSKQTRNVLDWLVTALETLRNTLIFTPIIITWYAISQASAKYNDLISIAVRNKNSDLYSQPFLYLWQQRFNGTLAVQAHVYEEVPAGGLFAVSVPDEGFAPPAGSIQGSTPVNNGHSVADPAIT